MSSASKLFEIVNAEREALLDLYASTGGPSWTNRSGWATDTPACEWFGVTCRSDGIVARISLSLNGLKGPLPPSIGTFTHLESLDLQYNKLSGSIPESIGLLAQLQKVTVPF